MPTAITRELMTLVRGEFRLSWGGHHGVAHWARVRGNGVILAARTGASRRVAELFAFLLDADISVRVCWDADRLDLGRVGIRPEPARLCTSFARDRKLMAWAYARSVRG